MTPGVEFYKRPVSRLKRAEKIRDILVCPSKNLFKPSVMRPLGPLSQSFQKREVVCPSKSLFKPSVIRPFQGPLSQSVQKREGIHTDLTGGRAARCGEYFRLGCVGAFVICRAAHLCETYFMRCETHGSLMPTFVPRLVASLVALVACCINELLFALCASVTVGEPTDQSTAIRVVSIVPPRQSLEH